MDFGALPPEINSARIYSGPGSRPLMQAAAAWQRLANELTATAASYSSVISGLTGDDWLGPSALSMAAAAVPYVAWMRATAASAEQAAAQAVAAANAYESAYAATVPPTVIAANRRTMLSLVKTNVFGQNTPAIATSEAQYGAMWAQDIVAMEGYAGASAAASQLPPFTPPPATTSGAGSLSDAAATAAQAVVPAAAATDVSLLPTLQSFLPPPFDAIPNPIEDLDVLVAAAVAVAAGSLGVSAAQLGEIYRRLPPGVVANLAATLAAIPGATIIVVPPSPNANQYRGARHDKNSGIAPGFAARLATPAGRQTGGKPVLD